MGELKPRVMNLLLNALQFESDSHNSQMLLGIRNVFFFNSFNLNIIFFPRGIIIMRSRFCVF